MCPRLPERSVLPSWGRFRMRKADLGPRTADLGLSVRLGKGRGPRSEVRGLRPAIRRFVALVILLTAGLSLVSCSGKPAPDALVVVIESSPTNLDPRVGIDAFSERIDNLIFDDLLSRGEDLNVAPGLAERWEIPDPLTYIFHLHRGVKFHDARPLSSRDVKWTFDSLLQGKIRSTKAAVYRF